MATTFVKIQTVTVGSGGAATIDFTSIPQTYTDLKLLVSVRTNRSAVVDALEIKFNNLTTNRSYREIYGSGSAAASSSGAALSGGYIPSATATASIFSNTEIYIPNYTSSNFKSASADNVGENNATESYLNLEANLWSATAAINQVTLYMSYGTLFNQYSSATLYGIKSS
jgi:hypothetical protein